MFKFLFFLSFLWLLFILKFVMLEIHFRRLSAMFGSHCLMWQKKREKEKKLRLFYPFISVCLSMAIDFYCSAMCLNAACLWFYSLNRYFRFFPDTKGFTLICWFVIFFSFLIQPFSISFLLNIYFWSFALSLHYNTMRMFLITLNDGISCVRW